MRLCLMILKIKNSIKMITVVINVFISNTFQLTSYLYITIVSYLTSGALIMKKSCVKKYKSNGVRILENINFHQTSCLVRFIKYL